MPDSCLAPSNWLAYEFSGKSDEILLLEPFCPNLDFEYKIARSSRLCQICIKDLSNNLSVKFHVNVIKF